VELRFYFDTVMKASKNVAILFSSALSQLFDISEFVYGETADNGEDATALQTYLQDTQYNTIVNNVGLQAIAEVLSRVPKKRTDANTDDAFPGRGCDGEDDIGGGEPDTCPEDRVLPTLVTPPFGFEQINSNSSRVIDKQFKSVSDAKTYLELNILASDDCAFVQQLMTEVEHVSSTTCQDTKFHVTPSEIRCPGTGYDVGNTESFFAYVDGEGPRTTCSFEPAAEIVDYQHNSADEGTTLFISSNKKKTLVDVGFIFDIEVRISAYHLKAV
jgi:hypothetical protein